MPLTLRPAEPADLPALVTLMNNAYRGVGSEASWNTETRYIEGPRTSEAHLIDEIAKKPAACLLIARESAGSALEGCVLLAPLSDSRWHLGSLAVAPSLQKSGLGKRLLEAAE